MIKIKDIIVLLKSELNYQFTSDIASLRPIWFE